MTGLLALALLAAPPSMVYPLQTAPNVTSTFGTYRISHHHAGLDLATNGDETIPVLAAADGVVTRIRRNDAGYGRAIYVRHADGWQTVYGHLSGYAPKLRAVVKAREETGQQFKLVFNLKKPFRVKKGEPLGWVGTSGTDLVHLHFELRHKGQPVNPLLHGLPIPDTTPPVIKRILLVPRTVGAHVNHAFDEAVITDFSAPIRIGGDVGIWAETNDRIDGSSRDLTPLEVELEVDGRTWHRTRYDQVSYADKRLTEFDFHLPRQAMKVGRYNALFAWGPKQTLHKTRGRSLKKLKPGTHTLRIIATDAKGNRTGQKLTVIVEKARPPCTLASSTIGKGKADAAFGAPVWRGRTVALPISNLCARFTAIDLRIDGVRQKKNLAFTTIGGAHAVVTGVPIKRGAAIQVRVKGADGIAETALRTHVIEPKAEIISGRLHIEVPKKATFWPYPTQIETLKNPGGPGLQPLSPIFRMHNRLYPSKGYMHIGVARQDHALGAVGMYLHANDRWWLLGGRDDDTHTYGGSVHLGDVALMRDTADPVIGQPRMESHPAGLRMIVPVSDKGAGISSVTMTVDGQPAFIERQKAFAQIIWLPLTAVTPGAHVIEVRAKDRAGRSSTAQFDVAWPARK